VRGLQAARGTPLSGQADGGPDRRAPGPGAPRPARPRVVILLTVAVLVLAADITTKAVVVATLSDRAPIRLLGGFLTLIESRNPGAAFSIGPSDTILFTAIAVGVIAFIVRTARRIYSLAWAIALGLLLGGATGNLTDRIFRAPGPFRGWVVDWIQVPHWPVFNLADSAIVCGGALMVLLAARGHRLDAEPQPAEPQSAEPQPAPAPPASSAPDAPAADGSEGPGPGASQRNGSQPDASRPAGPPPFASPSPSPSPSPSASASASASAPEPASAQPSAAEQSREHPAGGGSG